MKTPRWKVYNSSNEYVASCKYPEDAAALIAVYGYGTIRDGHRRIMWAEGEEEQPAGVSYDYVAATIYQRMLQNPHA